MREAADFRAEAGALAAATAPLSDADFAVETLFKGWTIGDVIGHLAFFDRIALLSLTDAAAYERAAAPVMALIARGGALVEAQKDWIAGDLGGPGGRALRDIWARGAARLAETFAGADPRARLKWLGPDMSARSSATARQMETWAHGQAVFDALGLDRVEGDRVRNICHLGVATYEWSFANRGETPPGPAPHVRLRAPSGAIWDWGAADAESRVEGAAVGFAQVVAQTRNVADTDLIATGAAARRWLAIAQCFAGPPEDPPAPGARRRAGGRP